MKKWIFGLMLLWSHAAFAMDTTVRIEDFKDFPETECSYSLRACLDTYAGPFLCTCLGVTLLIIYYNYPHSKKKTDEEACECV